MARAGLRYTGAGRAEEVAAGLAASAPGLCRVRRVGRSREGRPLTLLSVGRGGRQVLVVAGPHPNEPVGTATALHLARRAAHRADPGLTWHFLLCLDPDGAALTAGWLSGPPSARRHFRHFYRPAVEGQPEWLPEAGADSSSETAALVGLIDELRPDLQCSLHGVDAGGAFAQLTDALPGFGPAFARSAARTGIPLEVASHDAYFWPSPGPGVYLMPPPQAPAGFGAIEEADSTWAYARRYGGVTAVLEVPMWAVPAVADRRPHPAPGTAVRAAARRLVAGCERLAAEVPEGVDGGPLRRAAEWYLEVSPRLAADWLAEPVQGASVARVTGIELHAVRAPLRIAALLARLGAGPRAARAVAEGCRELRRFGARRVPVDRQVALQAAAVRAAVAALT
ncbi:hypothetical protein GCM10010441_29020 [Kitasatospora paracochleata]|uniref:Peptidase M14 domain-containing protein n=1 Tax=Kitasatospora paracochleata TaxID=58354 RepID=A0ABT1IZM0_9ACTN|nr:M14 family zinc carboxypeptidase [Kitasatospora paracochleata]MCP2310379.1 hypothetical protein [Kitasatospora paracochleata]